MATILLQVAGGAIGGLFGPVGAAIGQAVGALGGAAIDQALFNPGKTVRGRPLAGARVPGADEGDGINRVYGTARIAGTLIWATRFEETVTVERQGGKSSGAKIENFNYFGNFAVGLCEGEIAGIRRIWADGREIDQSSFTIRVYRGTEDQDADPLIEAKQGTGNAPAYRGLAYVVFERIPLDDFGNRIPVLHFEVIRPVGRLENQLKAVTLIPGATEHGYNPAVVTETLGPGESRNINRNVLHAGSDIAASLDELMAVCPNLEAVALVTAWFGTDLRAGSCEIRPGVETLSRADESKPWSVCGVARAAARLVSFNDGAPAYGGTPSDASVLAAIAELKNRNLKVFLYPFVLMDIPSGNGLADPYGAAEQAAYPWRGRITCMPAIGETGSVDQTAVARTQVDAFAGPAEAGDFAVGTGTVGYGGADWGYRRMVLHYAHLADLAGGVDGFIIGSELGGLTRVRDEADAFPFVEQLAALAGEVRLVLGSDCAITYGADWSEYFGYHPDDGSGDVFFHLDALWASDAIDAVGIDNYMPLADWRDSDLTSGNPDGFRTQSDPDGMQAMIASGEGYDWYYASAADRDARDRTPIADGLAGKPWVFRYKDLESWWSNQHFDRTGGAESATPTAWVPKSKPIWFTELGCPAVDKGPNQPNVFPDPKSSESALPYYSGGSRSDIAQRRFLQAHFDYWTGDNPPDDMVDPGRIFAWTWDARPWPAFPQVTSLWNDGPNWQTGHWLNGRLGAGTSADIIAAIMAENDDVPANVDAVEGDLTGYVVSDPASARQMLEPILSAFSIDAVEDKGTLRFQLRTRRAAAPISLPVLADRGDERPVDETRAQESDLSSEVIIDHTDPSDDYESAVARSRRLSAGNHRQERISLPGVMTSNEARIACDLWLRDQWGGRRNVRFALAPFDLAVEPGDVVALENTGSAAWLVTRVEDGAARRISARSTVSSAIAAASGAEKSAEQSLASSNIVPIVAYMDLPILTGNDETAWARVAGYSKPWRRVAVSSSAGTEGFVQRLTLDRPSRIGTLAASLAGGYPGRIDRSAEIVVDLPFGSFATAEATSVYGGANAIAIEAADGGWEIVQFLEAEEIDLGRWRLSGLLRGQAGTEDAMAAGADAGALVVGLDEAVRALGLKAGEAGLTLNWTAEPVGAAAGSQPVTVFAGGVRAITPLAPVHLAARRNAGGDIVVSWVRRGRYDADSWLAPEIPLGEAEERYSIEILDGETALREAEVTTPEYVYDAADETADFGELQTELNVRVRQIGSKVVGVAAIALFLSI